MIIETEKETVKQLFPSHQFFSSSSKVYFALISEGKFLRTGVNLNLLLHIHPYWEVYEVEQVH